MDQATTTAESTEEWRTVAGFENYEVSDLGRIRRRTNEGYRDLQPGRNVSGHLTIALRDAQGTNRWRYMHRLVLTAFKGEPEPGAFGRHYDDNPTNNRLDNLKWGTRQDNAADTIRNNKATKLPRVLPIEVRDHWEPERQAATQRHNLMLERITQLHNERVTLTAEFYTLRKSLQGSRAES